MVLDQSSSINQAWALKKANGSSFPGMTDVHIIRYLFNALWDCERGLFSEPRAVLWYSDMMTSPNGNVFRVIDPLCGEFTGHRSLLGKQL